MLSAEKKRIGEEFAASLGDERRLAATAQYIPALLAALDEVDTKQRRATYLLDQTIRLWTGDEDDWLYQKALSFLGQGEARTP